MVHKIHLYALSTCGWCRKTKKFLEDHGQAFSCDDVDLLTGPDKERVTNEVVRFNPRRSYPTVVIDDKVVIVGFDEERLREALGL
ncbi:MAG: glutaredoxin family protein [Myxococcales bacterium]|nr:glutaredoxin family protein [Myxococcales bacterium]